VNAAPVEAFRLGEGFHRAIEDAEIAPLAPGIIDYDLIY
jgi:hypothetical protein